MNNTKIPALVDLIFWGRDIVNKHNKERNDRLSEKIRNAVKNVGESQGDWAAVGQGRWGKGGRGGSR